MKKLILLLLIPIVTLGQTAKEREVNERVEYFKSQPIFVTQLSLNEKAIKKSSEKEIEAAKLEFERTNKNIRTAFITFWDINDTVIFVSDKELKAKQKEIKGAIFFQLFTLGEYTDEKGKVIQMTGFGLSRPNKADYFKNVIPRPDVDSSLVSIVTELRQLKLNVTTGQVINRKDLGRKIILIDKNELRSKFGENYVELLRSKFKDSIMEVDNKFLINALMRKDPKFIYVKNGATFNAEDGTMIPLN